MSAEDDEKARLLFKEGDGHYAAGRYEKAIELFEKAYELSKRPDLLFNLANAYERLGDYENAIDSLKRYVSSPDAVDISSVNERIERLEGNAAEKKRREKEAEERAAAETKKAIEPPPPEPRPTVTPTPTPQVDTPSRVPGIVVVSIGAALIGGGVVSGIIASGAGSDAEDQCTDSGLCPEAAESDLDRQKRFALISDISIGAGIVTTGIGVYLLLRNRSGKRAPATDVAVGPTRSGWAVTMTRRF